MRHLFSYVLVLFLVMIQWISAEEQILSPSTDLTPFVGKEITLRGFLYRSQGDQWFLASAPNLKSCCVGNGDKVKGQILIKHDFENAQQNRAITLHGVVGRDLNGIFHIHAVTFDAERSLSTTFIVIGVFLFAALVWCGWVFSSYFIRKR